MYLWLKKSVRYPVHIMWHSLKANSSSERRLICCKPHQEPFLWKVNNSLIKIILILAVIKFWYDDVSMQNKCCQFLHLNLKAFPYAGGLGQAAEFLCLLEPWAWGSLGSSSNVWLVGSLRRGFPPPHPQEHRGTGERKGAGLGVFSPSKNLSNTAEPLEE